MNREVTIRYTIEKDLEQLSWLNRQSHYGDTMIETNYNNMLSKFNDKSIMEFAQKFYKKLGYGESVGFGKNL